MAKLLRITTTENDGTFDNDLDSSFELPPNSTVALQSANFTFDTDELIMERLNEKFLFQLGNDVANQKDVTIVDRHGFFTPEEPEVYNNTNYDQFLKNFEASLNNDIYTFSTGVGEEDEVGYEAKVEMDINQKVNIRMERSQLVDWNNSHQAHQFVTENLEIVPANNNSFQKGAAAQDAFIVDRHPWNRGGTFARCRIHNLAGGGTNGFTFGLVSRVTLDNFFAGADLDPSDFCFSVTVDSTDVVMTQSTDDGETRVINVPTNVTLVNLAGGNVNDHDGFAFHTADGKFQCIHYSTTHPTGNEVVADFSALPEDADDYGNYNPNLDYYACLMIESTDDRSTFIDLVGAVNTPYFKKAVQPTPAKLTLTNKLQFHENVMRLATVPDIPTESSTFQLDFKFLETGSNLEINNQQLRDFMGYTLFSINTTPTVAKDIYNFVATVTGAGFLKTQTFVVQLVSLPVESYDTVSGKKENTIYTIVENVVLNKTQELSFNSQYPIYIQLKNRNPILLRRLKARIVDHDLLPIVTHGQSQLTLLFGTE